jgi:pyrimidine deaminase RibD-like protein
MDLDGAWWRALGLAWESYCAGSTPVGAVVLDAGGAIAGEGRGRRFEAAAHDRQLAHTHIAHAEINALAMLHLVWLLDMPAHPDVLEPHRAARSDSYQAANRVRSHLHELGRAHAPFATAIAATRL